MKKLFLLIFAIVLVACGDNGISPDGSSSFVRPVVETVDTNEVISNGFYTVEIMKFVDGVLDMTTEEHIINPINYYLNEVNSRHFVVTHIYKCVDIVKTLDIFKQYNFDYEELHDRYLNYGASLDWQFYNNDAVIIYYEKCYDGTGRYM